MSESGSLAVVPRCDKLIVILGPPGTPFVARSKRRKPRACRSCTDIWQHKESLDSTTSRTRLTSSCRSCKSSSSIMRSPLDFRSRSVRRELMGEGSGHRKMADIMVLIA